ncbi:hypothetical protein Tco_0856561 [Tanacetum coccineum]|uniref:Uncharacterized protein n=1 Tax=Tanacetum coccineum TaxID=301880 RepID=A0ABQ5B9C8_9ASTR
MAATPQNVELEAAEFLHKLVKESTYQPMKLATKIQVFSNTLVDHPNSSRLKDIKAKYNGIIRNTDLSDFAYAIKNNSIHHENQYGNDFSEMDYSLNFNDMSGNYNDGECSHGVEELDKNFINETDEENGEDSSKQKRQQR